MLNVIRRRHGNFPSEFLYSGAIYTNEKFDYISGVSGGNQQTFQENSYTSARNNLFEQWLAEDGQDQSMLETVLPALLGDIISLTYTRLENPVVNHFLFNTSPLTGKGELHHDGMGLVAVKFKDPAKSWEMYSAAVAELERELTTNTGLHLHEDVQNKDNHPLGAGAFIDRDGSSTNSLAFETYRHKGRDGAADLAVKTISGLDVHIVPVGSLDDVITLVQESLASNGPDSAAIKTKLGMNSLLLS